MSRTFAVPRFTMYPCRETGCERRVRKRGGICGPHAKRAWKKAHPEAVNGHNRRYNARRPEVMAASRAKWAQANPHASADRTAVRRSRKRGAFIEKVYRSKVLRLHAGLCGICGESVDPLDFHVDHVIPLARGGEHSYANTQPAHPPCNLRKAASLP